MAYPLMKYYTTIVSIALSLVVFGGILVYHVILATKDKWLNKLKCFRKPRYNMEPLDDTYDDDRDVMDEEGSPSHVINRRESLIYEVDIRDIDL
jgi:hypothetical protein